MDAFNSAVEMIDSIFIWPDWDINIWDYLELHGTSKEQKSYVYWIIQGMFWKKWEIMLMLKAEEMLNKKFLSLNK